LANCALRIRLMSSSVLPENMEPHTTSILPGRCASPVTVSIIMCAKVQISLEFTMTREEFFTAGKDK
jgi:hypothetical protein